MHLADRFYVDVGWVKRQFLATFWAFAVKALNNFVGRRKLNPFIENCAAF